MIGIDEATRRDVIDAVTEFQHRLDTGASVADLFEADAVFHRTPTSVEGAEAIARFFADRRATRTVRHLSSNFRFQEREDGTVAVRYIVIAFHGREGRVEQAGLGDATDEWRRGEDGRWRLRSTAFEPVFGHGA